MPVGRAKDQPVSGVIDWKFAADVGEQLTFPQEVAVTTCHPDTHIISHKYGFAAQHILELPPLRAALSTSSLKDESICA